MLYFSRWQTAAILGLIAFVCLAAVPSLVPWRVSIQLPNWAQRTITAGADIRGGRHYEFAVDAMYVRRAMAEELRDDMRRVLREGRLGYTGLALRGHTVEVRMREVWDMPLAIAQLNQLVDPWFGPALPRPDRPIDATFRFESTGANTLDRGPRLRMTIDGQWVRLTPTEVGIRERIAQQRDQAMLFIERRMGEVGRKLNTFNIRPTGVGGIVVDQIGRNDDWRYILYSL